MRRPHPGHSNSGGLGGGNFACGIGAGAVDQLGDEVAHSPRATATLKLAAPSRTVVMIPLLRKLVGPSADVAPVIRQWRITQRTPQRRRRGGRGRLIPPMLLRTSCR